MFPIPHPIPTPTLEFTPTRGNKVGWIFAHPPREEGFLFSSAEVITAATLQLEAADGVNDTPFVTVKVSAGASAGVSFKCYPLL